LSSPELHNLFRLAIVVKTDLVTACELELFVKSLISPLYLWQNGYLTGAGKVNRLKTEKP